MLLCICKKEDSISHLIYFWRTDCYAKAELPTGSADRFMHHTSTQLKAFLYTSAAIPHQKHTEGSDALLLRWSADKILLEETQRGTLCKNYLTLYHTPELWFFFFQIVTSWEMLPWQLHYFRVITELCQMPDSRSTYSFGFEKSKIQRLKLCTENPQKSNININHY